MDYAEIGNPALGLAAYGARLAYSPWPLADLRWRPANAATARQGWVSLRLLAGLGFPALALEFLHAGADRCEIVGSAGSVAQLLHSELEWLRSRQLHGAGSRLLLPCWSLLSSQRSADGSPAEATLNGSTAWWKPLSHGVLHNPHQAAAPARVGLLLCGRSGRLVVGSSRSS